MEKGCPPLHGLRHLALRVRDIRRAKDFYQRIFNMKIVWEPDSQNCYLSSGTDDLALHEAPAPGNPEPAQPLWSSLDHFRSIAGSPLGDAACAELVTQTVGGVVACPELLGEGT